MSTDFSVTAELLHNIGFDAEDISYVLSQDRKYGAVIHNIASDYMKDKGRRNRVPYSEEELTNSHESMTEHLKSADEVCADSDNEYIANLLFWLHCVPFAEKLYKQQGISEDVFYDSMSDISCKTRECKRKRGKCGTYVTWDWFSLFFDLLLFGLGRLQFYIETFQCDSYRFGEYELKRGDKVYSCHVPSTGKLLKDKCMESFQNAYEFFKEDLDSTVIPIVCRSWLLFPPYLEKVFTKHSNLAGFAQLFDIIDTISSGNTFLDCPNIFLKTYEGSTEGFPADNTLRRNYIEYINAGNTFGYGYGVILYDGEKRQILNQSKGGT